MVPICSNMSGFAADCHSSMLLLNPPVSTYPHLGPPKKLAGHRKFIHETGSEHRHAMGWKAVRPIQAPLPIQAARAPRNPDFS